MGHTMLRHALKEWSAICKALATGQQAILLRKGGIEEPDGDFQIEQTRFWLFPTYVHQQLEGLQERAKPLLGQALAEKPAPGIVRLSHFAEVTGVYRIRALPPALLLAHLHFWSRETVTKRYNYRVPELYIIPVRVWKSVEAIELPDLEAYRGCRSWVTLDTELPTSGATPVLTEDAMDDVHRQLDLLLNPSAIV
jgi:hypothetical protein